MRWRCACVPIAAGLFAAGCVVVPVQTDAYDPTCQVLTHHIELQPVVLGQIQHCGGQGCEALVLASLGVTAVSAVVSGSIAVVGNVVYWADHRVGCAAASSMPAPAAPPSM